MPEIWLLFATMFFVCRAAPLRRLWRLPMKNGEDRFLTQHVGPGFYREDGAVLLRRYRASLVVPLLLDVPLSVWLVVTRRFEFLAVAQFILMLLTNVVYNVIIAHFSYRAQAMAGIEQEPPATMMQLSMAPRRLRDHSNRAVESLILAAMVLVLALLARAYALATADDGTQADHLRGGIVLTIWTFYVQVGLLLLKVVFVRWRMPLPARRTDDFRQWRSGWLSYHLKVFDSIRVLYALALVTAVWIRLSWNGWSPGSVIVACSLWIPAIIAFVVYVVRERRRLAALEREIKPIEMLKEFPRRPIPQGRFLAGGLLYFNRDNPVVLVRSAQGIAINLAHPNLYFGAAYFIGLALLMTWMAR
jgi:hypothetical protein